MKNEKEVLTTLQKCIIEMGIEPNKNWFFFKDGNLMIKDQLIGLRADQISMIRYYMFEKETLGYIVLYCLKNGALQRLYVYVNLFSGDIARIKLEIDHYVTTHIDGFRNVERFFREGQ